MVFKNFFFFNLWLSCDVPIWLQNLALASQRNKGSYLVGRSHYHAQRPSLNSQSEVLWLVEQCCGVSPVPPLSLSLSLPHSTPRLGRGSKGDHNIASPPMKLPCAGAPGSLSLASWQGEASARPLTVIVVHKSLALSGYTSALTAFSWPPWATCSPPTFHGSPPRSPCC